MEIEYSLSLEDLLALNLYHNTHSPTLRRQRLLGRLLIPAVLLIMWLSRVSPWRRLPFEYFNRTPGLAGASLPSPEVSDRIGASTANQADSAGGPVG